MEGPPPITITVYDAGNARKGVVGAPNTVSGAIRKNAPGEFTFTVDADHRRVNDLTADGARAAVKYRYAPDVSEMVLLSGPVSEAAGSGVGSGAVRTFTIEDDWNLLNDVTGWPNPTGTHLQQGTSAYFRRSGPAETVLKQIVAANMSRLGIPLTIPATEGRGTAITVQIRMHSLAERLFPAVDLAGLNVRILQIATARTLLVSTPAVHTRVLTEESGVVVGGEFQITRPTTTRVVVGAGGEATARIFRLFIDDALELQYGGGNGRRLIRERSIDARDVGLEDGATALTAAQETTLQQRANEALAEGAPKVGLSVTLAETPNWRFAKTFQLGDQVPLKLKNSPVMTDYVREVGFSWDTSGLAVTPIVGNWTESTQDKIVAAVAQTVRAVRDLQRST